MLFVIGRLFLRLFFFFIALISIVFFYLLGYKYDPDLGFVKNFSVYSFQSFSDMEKIVSINGNDYYLVDGKLTIYKNLGNTCGDFRFGKFKDFICYSNDNYTKLVYIPYNNIRFYKLNNAIFQKLTLHKSSDVFEKYNFLWNNIRFSYYNNGDLLYYDDLGGKKLISLQDADFLGYDKKGLYVIKNKYIYYLKLVK